MPKHLNSHIKELNLQALPLSDRKSEVDMLNEIHGTLSAAEYDCKVCLNKGVIFYMEGEEVVCKECECIRTRKSLISMSRSGLSEIMSVKNFKNFEIEHDFQKLMRDNAVKFVREKGRCFFIGGQVGCGKTHICTAIAGYMIKHGKGVRYLQWRDDTPKLKAGMADGDSLTEIEKLKKIDVLYIDDLFKNQQGQEPTNADINLAFDIINYRYINSELITIISSEKTFVELLTIDEAIASRIAEMSTGYTLSIAKDIRKNYRLKDVLKNESSYTE